MSSCCSPEGRSGQGDHAHAAPQTFSLAVPPLAAPPRQGGGAPAGAPGPNAEHHIDVAVPAGTFEMGDAFDEGYPADGETPVHPVALSAFRIDTTAVTNAAFAAFTSATGYRTESEM